jgi:Zn finger protein HypA/HybF involved in hydrogenase expression
LILIVLLLIIQEINHNLEKDKMCETKIEFKCLYCGALYNPNEELDCPECNGKDKIVDTINSSFTNKNLSGS